VDFLVHHMLRTSAKRNPAKEALVHGSKRLNYQDVARQTAGLAHGLRRAGLQRGERVAIYLEASVAQVLSIFSVSEAGGALVPINALLHPEQVAYIARDCEIRGLVTTPAKLRQLVEVLPQIPSLRFIILTGEGEFPEVSLPCLQFEELTQLPPFQNSNERTIDKDLAAILYTSGSTGKPKGVMLSHANVVAGSLIVSTYLEIKENERILAVLPFSFDAGLNQLMTAFQQGAALEGADNRISRCSHRMEPPGTTQFHAAKTTVAGSSLHYEYRRSDAPDRAFALTASAPHNENFLDVRADRGLSLDVPRT
jgi:acyl-CoA synthetase (AMP-forming)/AMP-acid ligase II